MSEVVYDTSVVIDLQQAALGDWAESVPAISAVTLAELHFGLELGDAVTRAERRNRLALIRASYQILPFGEDEAEAYGLLATLVREAGRNPRGRALDLQIAATAAVLRVPLLTRNARDLAGIERVVQVIEVG